MSALGRIVGFGLVLAAVFAVAALAGAAIDPGVDESDDAHGEDPMAMAGHEGAGQAAAALPGLASAQDGYRLVPERTRLQAGDRAAFGFRIVDASGATVRDFDVEHERRMHLIIVRRDFEGFQHLHPRQLDDGSWVAEADLAEAGAYRAFADFATGGEALTLATDLFVAGEFEPTPLPAPAPVADAGDGYEVRIESPAPIGGETAPVQLTVTRGGQPVDSIEPYLGADGHLVALREHDQAFLHTHPQGEPGGTGPITFEVEYPTPGRYRLFLQFKHAGEVHTAAFTQVVG
jgi:hypothetical protein